jgi:hypothetical protein
VLFFVAFFDEPVAVTVLEFARAVTRREARAQTKDVSYSHGPNDDRSSPRPSMFDST